MATVATKIHGAENCIPVSSHCLPGYLDVETEAEMTMRSVISVKKSLVHHADLWHKEATYTENVTGAHTGGHLWMCKQLRHNGLIHIFSF